VRRSEATFGDDVGADVRDELLIIASKQDEQAAA